MKRLLFLFTLAMGLILTGCGGGGDGTKDEGNGTDQVTKTEEDVKDKVFKVGESAELEGTAVTVTNVEKSQGDEWDKPQEGKEFVIVTVKYENKGDENSSYNPFDFTLKNSQGQIVDQSLVITEGWSTLQSGELAPGGTVEGTVTFEAPVGDTGLQLIYTPNLFDDEKNIVFDLQ